MVTLLNNLPSNVHPMSQFCAAIAALNSESKFAKAYEQGVHKSKYWEDTFEDSMDLIAKLPVVAATIYNNLFRYLLISCTRALKLTLTCLGREPCRAPPTRARTGARTSPR